MRIAQLVEQLARHPLHQLRLARTESLAGGKFYHLVAALLQAQETGFDRGRQLTRPQAQRGGLAVVKGVDDVAAIRTGHAVVQGQKRTGFDGGHGDHQKSAPHSAGAPEDTARSAGKTAIVERAPTDGIIRGAFRELT